LIASATRAGYIAIVPLALAEEALAGGRVQRLRDVEPSTAAIHAIFPDTVPARRAVELLRTTSNHTQKSVTESNPGPS
jgi:DNA-binding transcriptional LysR family regulator